MASAAPLEPFDPGATPSRQSARLARSMLRTMRPASRLVRTDRAAIGLLRSAMRTPLLRTRVPPDIRVEAVDRRVGGRRLIGEWLRPAGSEEHRGTILYLHGSGWVCSSPKTHRAITVPLARRTGMALFAVQYRLAPKHPFPAAADDILAAYRYLLGRDIAPERMVVAGDSAGGNMAVGLAVDCAREDLPRPAGMVLMSPLVDATWELAAARDRESPDPMVSAAVAKRITASYFGQADHSDPRIALLESDPAVLPPCLIQAGGLEMMSADAEALAAHIEAGGGECELQIWPGQVHVFQALSRLLPEARAALRHAARFIERTV